MMYFDEMFDSLNPAIISRVTVEMLQHKGKKKVICADRVMEKLHVECSNSIARKYLHAAAIRDGLPMVSNNRGFYLATCQQDMDDYNENINKRITEMCRVQKAVNTAFNDWREER